MDWSKLHKLVEAVNTYYAFAVLIYVAVLYVSGNSQIFLWVLFALTPVLAGWTGYLLRSYLSLRNQKHGFRLLSQAMTYEILPNHKYLLKFAISLQSEANRMMVFPVGYQWSGGGHGSIPRILTPGQQLIGVVKDYDTHTNTAHVTAHTENVSSEDDWSYWFVGFNRAMYKGEKTEIKYVQEFVDKQHIAKPCLYYMVNSPMDKLVLNVNFNDGELPQNVTCSYFKLSDRRRSYPSQGMEYDPDKQWATWTIDKPKYGYCYRIDWK
jgi:hypothetical protein